MLYPRLVRRGIEVDLYARAGYVPKQPYSFQGTHVIPLSVIRSRSLESVSHTCMSILHAHRSGSRFMHLHAIGPAIWSPFAKRLGFKVVVTHHGFDYRRQKWGASAKVMLRRGEQMAIRHADGIICISREILESVRAASPVGRLALIPNGVELPAPPPSPSVLSKWGLQAGRYFLLTARFVREKGITDLIEGWARSGIQEGVGLAIAGDEDYPSDLGREIRKLAAETGAVLTGRVFGEDLSALYGHARGFVLPSFHEGLPISLLEAMSWGLPVAASSIEANMEVGLPADCYFEAGSPDGIADRLRWLASGPARVDHSAMMTNYDWDRIADSTIEFYSQVLGS